MNFKRLLLVSVFLLAILTIGAASASENLTDSNASDGDVILENSEVSEVLNDGSYYDDDFYIYVEENYTQSERDWNSRELIYIASYCDKNSTIDILVDNTEKQTITVTDGHFSVGIDENGTQYYNYNTFVYPTDLSLDYGLHTLKVNVNGNTCIDTSISINEKEDFTIWLQNPYYCEEEYWQSPSFLIIDSNNLNNATLEIYVNGTRKLSYAVTNGLFEHIENSGDKSRYVAPSDLFDDYGNYNIQIRLTENGETKTLREENVAVAEYAPTVNPQLDVYFDFYTLIIPADNIAHIYLPREATGNLTISYNNVLNKTVQYSKGYGEDYMESWNLNHLGENLITITYTGDDFGVMTKTANVTVLPDITCPGYVKVGEEFTISLMTFGWVNGQLYVYEYTNGVKGKLLTSGDIDAYSYGNFALTSLNLSLSKSGLNELCLDYYDIAFGHYTIIENVYVVENSKNVSVDVFEEVETGTSLNVTVNAPDIDFTFAQISVDGGESEFVMLENGTAVKSISNLTAGYHSIKVFYENQYYDGSKWTGDVYLNTFTVNVGSRTKISASDVVIDYTSYDDMIITLKDDKGIVLSGKEIRIDLNSKKYVLKSDAKGQARFTVKNLPAGNYTASLSFNGSEGYLSTDATSKITVNRIKTKLSAQDLNVSYGESNTLEITLTDDKGAVLTDKEITVNIGGKNYTATSDDKGIASISLDLDAGDYTAEIIFRGDNNYIESDCTSSVTVNKIKTKLTAPSITAVYNVAKNLVITLKSEDGKIITGQNVIVTLNGKSYTTDSSGQVKVSSYNMAPKTYSFSVRFEGNKNYLSSSISTKITVGKATPKITASNKAFKLKTKSKQYTITLKNNKNAIMKNKKVTLKVKGKTYTAKTNSKGKATFKITKLTKKGTYKAVIKYAGDSYYKSVTKNVKITVKK